MASGVNRTDCDNCNSTAVNKLLSANIFSTSSYQLDTDNIIQNVCTNTGCSYHDPFSVSWLLPLKHAFKYETKAKKISFAHSF